MVTTRSGNEFTGAAVTNSRTRATRNANTVATMEEMAELLRSAREQLAKNEAEIRQLRYEMDVFASELERGAGGYDRRSRRDVDYSPTRSDAATTPLHSATLRPAGRRGGGGGGGGGDSDDNGNGNGNMGGNGSFGNARRTRKFEYKHFHSCEPPKFTGDVTPVESLRWLRGIEMTFEACDCPEDKKVVCAVKMLKDAALDWWDTRIQILGVRQIARMTWESFVTLFQNEYCSDRDLRVLKEEFISLEKGDDSIKKYNRLFVEKLRFCKHLCRDEVSQVSRYASGLPAEYKTVVRTQTTLKKAMEMAESFEDDLKDHRKDKGDMVSGSKRKLDNSSSSGKEYKDDGDAENWCSWCKSYHSGSCTDKTLRCYRCAGMGHMSKDCTSEARCYTCKQTGHRMADCPQAETTENKDERPKAQARVYQMVAEEVETDD